MKKYLILLLAICSLSIISCEEDEVKTSNIEKIELTPSRFEMEIGSLKQIEAVITPEEALKSDLVWSSSDMEVATVEQGMVMAHKLGKATIKAESKEGDVYAVSKLTVTDKIIEVESIHFDTENYTVMVNETAQICATIMPNNASDTTLVWNSSDKSICTVDRMGLLVGVREGKATITASSPNGVKQSCEVNVDFVPIESLKWKYTWTDIYVGDVFWMEITFVPLRPTYTEIDYKSDAPEVCEFAGPAIIRALKTGDATLSATCHSGLKIEKDVTVKEISGKDGFMISPEITVNSHNIQDRARCYVEFFNSDNKKELTWTIADENILKFKKEGGSIVKFRGLHPELELGSTAKDGDTTTITATDNEGNSSTCKVTISTQEDYIVLFKIEETTIPTQVKLGSPIEIKGALTPSYATVSKVIYVNKDDEVGTLTEDGIFTPKKVGITRVYAWSCDDGYVFRRNIRVVE